MFGIVNIEKMEVSGPVLQQQNPVIELMLFQEMF